MKLQAKWLAYGGIFVSLYLIIAVNGLLLESMIRFLCVAKKRTRIEI